MSSESHTFIALVLASSYRVTEGSLSIVSIHCRSALLLYRVKNTCTSASERTHTHTLTQISQAPEAE